MFGRKRPCIIALLGKSLPENSHFFGEMFQKMAKDANLRDFFSPSRAQPLHPISSL
jgi:hypothetical protein